MIRPYPEYRPIAKINSRRGAADEVCRGYDESVIEQLVAKSNEKDITNRCPKDAQSRFASEAAFGAWAKKGRFLYPLVSAQTGELSGVIWMGAEKFKDEKYEDSTELTIGKLMSDTYAIRTYASTNEFDARGRRVGSGIAKPFTRAAIADYTNMRLMEGPESWPTFTGLHLETDLDNIRARSTYENLGGPAVGFVVVGENVAENRVAMALPLPNINQVLGIQVVT
jgi:hypothetical protein